jgi:hypothetical protein
MDQTALAPPPRCSAGAAPARRPGSVRRTSSIDVTWPDGRAGKMRLIGRARDAVTPRAGGPPCVCVPVVLAEDSFEARLTPDRAIAEIAAEPPRPELAGVVGARAGGGLRQAMEAAVPEERRHATPLHLILDDMAGASLVANWAWSQWDPNWLETARAVFGEGAWAKRLAQREGICIGFAPGSSALEETTPRGAPTYAPDLRNPADPEGWHAFPEATGVAFRRARRIDLWRDGLIRIDAAFQDSTTTPTGQRAVVHEYTLTATADPESLRLVSVEAQPRVLPHRECPAAAGNLGRLSGAPLAELRERVLVELAGVAGCTHLNDALRDLAEAPSLLLQLPA